MTPAGQAGKFDLEHQRGAALFFMLLILLSGALSLLFKSAGGWNGAAAETATSAQALAQAREHALSFAVTNSDAPGGLPFPDRNDDGNYDGQEDTPAVFDPTLHLLGQCPTRLFSTIMRDASGATLWYAASANLLRSQPGGTYPIINSEAASGGWFTVVNGQGSVLTNRAALVLLAPGRALPFQNRTGTAAANHFLEGVHIGGVQYTNYAVEAMDSGFVTQAGDTTVCNDLVLYVTIDELMTKVEKRILGQFKALLRDYVAGCGQFPWPRPYIDPRSAPDFNSVAGTIEGLLPLQSALPANWGGGCASSVTVPAWLLANQWHHLGYYALGSAAVQAGHGCSVGIDCLTVDGYPLPNNNKEALILLAGAALSGQSRISPTGITDYFEAENALPGDRLFTTHAAAPFNDRLEIVQ